MIMAVTLQKSTGTFPSGGTTITLYGAKEESRTKNANLITLALPRSDASSSLAYDLLGVEADFSYSGVVTSSDATLATWVGDFDNLISGTQVYSILTLGLAIGATTTKNVKVDTLSWRYIAGEPGTLEYSIKLIESSTS